MVGSRQQRRIVPAHLALIPDGNRRWAKSNRISLINGYQNGIKKFISFGIWAKRMGVKTLSVWALSTENIANRSGAELGILYALYQKAAVDPEIFKVLSENNARIRVIGDMSRVPRKVREALASLERRTAAYRDFTINLLIGYGGREDILYGARNGERLGAGLDQKSFGSMIRSADIPDVDLVIRTSGEHRLSGFLPWQSSYSELYFSRKYWPDFERRDLSRAIRSYASRDRRLGK